MTRESTGAQGALLSAAAFVVVTAGIQAAASIVIPLLMAVFIAVLCLPGLLWLEDQGLPGWLAIGIVVLAVVLVMLGLGGFVGGSVAAFSQAVPRYDRGLDALVAGWLSQLSELGLRVEEESLREALDAGRVMGLVGGLLSSFGVLMTNAFLILLTATFILIEASSFPRKIGQIVRDGEGFEDQLRVILSNVQRYLAIKTVTSLATGALVALALTLFGLDFPIMWGLFAFLLNFVPNVGSILAALPPLLLSLLQLGPASTLGIAGAYLAVNMLIGSVIEPRVMGHGLGLSPLVVIVSLIFWGWVLGPVGMLLSVPLTMTAKIALESHADTRWIAILLGPARAPMAASAEPAQRSPHTQETP